ncbi:DUF3300 domain-containing protein [Sedimentitalea nanhaiensis]|uniref:DUF3300 domain-containing protein n=1 Tax=Sedimentitalea nanhaiensis TaxID=999627 RepID=A0A1I7B8L9_9RHOB|nr:DUF3300 domain-containing protein [Sedimentitalea nanhaiensis]SFT83505.1 Protein of unknown function [Sedimentitalea nanhaiensis]
MPQTFKHLVTAICLAAAPMAVAQSDTPAGGEPGADPTAAQTGADDALLTEAELETLVAPVALYPDTLLIQILVASTYPLDVVKADRLLDANADTEANALQDSIKAEGYDASVEVLATAFPEVIADMADHVEWTETMGDAMVAQSDDVMNAVQVMRQQAIDSGALTSGDAQTVEVSNTNEVIIQPTDPEVVYVPQYDPQVVYQDSNTVGDAVMAGAIAFGTYAVMDAIFDNDDPWNNYWGCHNCGGWGGNPIVRNPNIDLDVDGNINIGNKVNIGDGDGIGWKPDDKRRQDAKDKIANKRGPDGATTLPVNKGDTRGDAMRANLSKKSGAADISRPGGANKLPKVDRPSARPTGTKKDAIAKTRPAAKKPAVNRPAVKKPAAHKQVARKAAPAHRPSAMTKKAPARQARASSHRGKAGGGHRGRR